jgi:hypothetical protein
MGEKKEFAPMVVRYLAETVSQGFGKGNKSMGKGVIYMNRIAKIVALLVALTAAFSFGQSIDSLERQIIDSLQAIINNNITTETLIKSQELYNTSFANMQSSFHTFVASVCGIITILSLLSIYLNFKISSNMKEELNKERNKFESRLKEDNEKIINKLEERHKLFSKELEEHKKDMKNESEDARKKIIEMEGKLKKEIDTSLRLLSRIHRGLALENLKKNEFHDYFFNMHVFYRCLAGINSLNKHDLERLNETYELLLEKYGKNAKKIDEIKGEDVFRWFFEHLLNFIKHCDDLKQNESFAVFEKAKIIYNDLCEKFNYNDIRKELEKLKERPEIALKLAEHYRDKTLDSSPLQ